MQKLYCYKSAKSYLTRKVNTRCRYVFGIKTGCMMKVLRMFLG